MNKKVRNLVLVALCFLGFTSAYVGNKYFEISKQLEIFNDIYKDLNMFYVDEVEPKKLMDNAINGMLEKLDPYTTYMNESESEDYMYRTEGEYGGVGLVTKKIDNKMYILEIYKDSPLQGKDVKVGDYVLEVNDVTVEGKSDEEITNLVVGSPGSEVKLKFSDGKNDKEITIKRENIKISAVEYFQMIDKEIGYIRLSVFSVKTLTEFLEAFNILKEKGMKKLIIDLRDNPGGLLDQAIKICNLFVEKNVEIVNTKGKLEEWNNSYKTEAQGNDMDIPIAIIVNNGSASASEIVSGGLQDLDRAVVIGQNTFGKGLVQQLRPLSYGSQLKITTSRYYIPSGRCIQEINYFGDDLKLNVKKEFKTKNGRIVYEGKGIKPDIEIKNDIKPLMLLQELLSENYIFFFVNDYLSKNKVESLEDFKLAENTFDDFMKYLKKEKFDFKSRADLTFDKLKDEVEKEGLTEFGKEIKKLSSLLENEKKEYLVKYKERILLKISREILKRKFLKEGMIKFDLNNSQEIKESIKILGDQKKYNQILGKK